ncbi:MAG: Jag N-terminal domain-containing protein [Deltaproteobacteria bacterium]|nr:Jag N-terminal domain-containing protein [Deltaproteobacteria bacterium]
MARYEFEGRSAAEAAIKACEELGITRSALRYDVVSENGSGIEKSVLISVEHDPTTAQAAVGAFERNAEGDDYRHQGYSDNYQYGNDRDEERPYSRGYNNRGRYGRTDRHNSRNFRGGRNFYSDRGDRADYGGRGGRSARGRSDRDGMPTRRMSIPQEADDAFEALLNLDEFPNNGIERGELTGDISPIAIQAKTMLNGVLERMKFAACGIVVQDDAQEIHLDIRGDEAKRVIGNKGEPLLSLQFLINRMVARENEREPVVVLDVAGYRERRRAALADLARKLAQRAVAERKIVKLSPMSAHDRRVFHLTLTPEMGVTTQSEGEGLFRRLLIIPLEFANRNNSD